MRKQLGELALPSIIFSKAVVNGQELNAFLIPPVGYSHGRKYPVLLYIYGGPGSQTVMDSFRGIGFEEYMASQGIAVVSIDGSGTGARGQDFMFEVYKNLGVKQATQLADGVRDMATKHDFLDISRVAVWGWSFGGYQTLMCLTEVDPLFKAGIAVAPVTDWRFYDSAYTERYMSTPQENDAGYTSSSVIHRLTNLSEFSPKLMLVHGTGDDNVHFLNSATLVTELVRQEIQFRLMYYTNRDHSINGGNSRQHLYRMLSNFLVEEL